MLFLTEVEAYTTNGIEPKHARIRYSFDSPSPASASIEIQAAYLIFCHLNRLRSEVVVNYSAYTYWEDGEHEHFVSDIWAITPDEAD